MALCRHRGIVQHQHRQPQQIVPCRQAGEGGRGQVVIQAATKQGWQPGRGEEGCSCAPKAAQIATTQTPRQQQHTHRSVRPCPRARCRGGSSCPGQCPAAGRHGSSPRSAAAGKGGGERSWGSLFRAGRGTRFLCCGIGQHGVRQVVTQCQSGPGSPLTLQYADRRWRTSTILPGTHHSLRLARMSAEAQGPRGSRAGGQGQAGA